MGSLTTLPLVVFVILAFCLVQLAIRIIRTLTRKLVNTRIWKNMYEKKYILRGHSDLNQGPIGLQPIALPLSYTPNWQFKSSNKCTCLNSEHPFYLFENSFCPKTDIGNEVEGLHLIKIISYQNKEISQNHKESDAFSEPVSTSSTRHDDSARCRFSLEVYFFRD